MTSQEMLSHIDHTQLKAFATWEDIKTLCEEAVLYKTASVCIPSCYVKRVKDTYTDSINICTVVGFPLGYANTEAKVAETKKAIEDGASEIDMVINISDVKNGLYDAVEEEIRTLKNVCGVKVLKVIIETCYLTQDEKIAMCKAVTNAGADYIKTSTGFSTGGATIADVELFEKHMKGLTLIKAAGGISSIADAEDFITLGASRLGTSRIVKLAKQETDNSSY